MTKTVEQQAIEHAKKVGNISQLTQEPCEQTIRDFKAGYEAASAEKDILERIQSDYEKQIHALRTELEDSKRDSLRLDWMIENDATITKYHDGFKLFTDCGVIGRKKNYAEPREAIDAAMKEGK